MRFSDAFFRVLALVGVALLLWSVPALAAQVNAQETYRANHPNANSPTSDARGQATPQASFVLEVGTRVQLMLAENLETATRGGSVEGVKFQVFPEVRVGDLVLIERGAYAWGRAEMIRKASFRRNGIVRVTALRALAITGVEIPLRGNATEEGPPSCLNLGCDLFEFWFAGKDAVMERGTKVQAHVAKNVSFDTAAVKEAMAEAERKKALERSTRRNKASVYIYRMSYEPDKPAAWLAAIYNDPALQSGADLETLLRSRVCVDGHEVVRLMEYRFIALGLRPGKHLIGTDKSSVELDLIGGEDYYLRISGGSKEQLGLVSTGEGEEQIYPMDSVSEEPEVQEGCSMRARK